MDAGMDGLVGQNVLSLWNMSPQFVAEVRSVAFAEACFRESESLRLK